MLGSCSLSALEFHLLGVRRTQRDVPGAVIPFLYREHLAGGGALTEGMDRVMYHNMTDILSMVALAGRLAEARASPRSTTQPAATTNAWATSKARSGVIAPRWRSATRRPAMACIWPRCVIWRACLSAVARWPRQARFGSAWPSATM